MTTTAQIEAHDSHGRPCGLDDRDREILGERFCAMEQREGPRVGDWVKMVDGSWRRFSHDWDEDIQTSDGGSFHLNESGAVSFSGGLHPAQPKTSFVDTGRRREGRVWFFHHGYQRAHNARHVTVPFRVYAEVRTVPADELEPGLRIVSRFGTSGLSLFEVETVEQDQGWLRVDGYKRVRAGVCGPASATYKHSELVDVIGEDGAV